ncbi:hypothetical protein V1520DRAFT_350826 [Lipomyces starkeyi]|uniref:Uncharacterized protein n=1 Tax=Lipomyces starkeyi NRRL Y-11557 TaxID=675824 RepID=A0A1E3PVR0_LIPST|nr:hypothetical protein LIPSTDRAFT_76191 [Lipomyces starkeyi NRRL Y-11557]
MKTNDSAAYTAALDLNPCMKWEYITSTWQAEWIPDAKALVAKLWKKYRRSSDTTVPNPNVFTIWKLQKSARRADYVDEYVRHIREPPVPQDHIKQGARSWWLEERQQRLISKSIKNGA